MHNIEVVAIGGDDGRSSELKAPHDFDTDGLGETIKVHPSSLMVRDDAVGMEEGGDSDEGVEVATKLLVIHISKHLSAMNQAVEIMEGEATSSVQVGVIHTDLGQELLEGPHRV